MLPRNDPDRIQVTFDDHRLVANAGLLLPVTLAQHLGLRELVDNHVDLGDAPGRANTGDKMLTLVASALAGGDCIDDAAARTPARKVSKSATTAAKPKASPKPKRVRLTPEERQERARARAVETRSKLKDTDL